jgi:hypothetical protein
MGKDVAPAAENNPTIVSGKGQILKSTLLMIVRVKKWQSARRTTVLGNQEQAAQRMRTFFSGKSRLRGQRQLSTSWRSKHLMGPLKRNGHLEGRRA